MQKQLNLSLAIVGTILPYYFLVSFLIQNDQDIHRIWDQLFLSESGAFNVMDVFIYRSYTGLSSSLKNVNWVRETCGFTQY